MRLNELLRVECRLCGVDFATDYGPERPGDIRHSYADVGKALALFGCSAGVVLSDGLACMLI